MAAPEVRRDGDAPRAWVWVCSTCDAFDYEFISEADARAFAEQHAESDEHRMNEVHESRRSRRG